MSKIQRSTSSSAKPEKKQALKYRVTRPKRPLSLGPLSSYYAVADGIVQLFPPYTEVVLHELATQTVVYVANNQSKRELGDDSALDNIEFDPQEMVIGPYEKIGCDGRVVRSISFILRTEASEPIGVMCINFHLAALKQAKQALELLVSNAVVQPRPEKLFHDDWQERVNVFLHHWLQERKLTLSMLTREDKRVLVEALYKEGAFKGKSAANYVARLLLMGRATVFNHLKDLRSNR